MSNRGAMLVFILVLQGCASTEIHKTPATQAEEVIESSADKYVRLKKKNLEQIENNNSKQQYKVFERQIQHLVMDLLAKLSNAGDQSIVVDPVTLAAQVSGLRAGEGADLINSLLIQELTEFGLTVVDYNDEVHDANLTLYTHISLYQDSYLINCYIKQSGLSKIESTVQTSFPVGALGLFKDGVRVFN